MHVALFLSVFRQKGMRGLCSASCCGLDTRGDTVPNHSLCFPCLHSGSAVTGTIGAALSVSHLCPPFFVMTDLILCAGSWGGRILQWRWENFITGSSPPPFFFSYQYQEREKICISRPWNSSRSFSSKYLPTMHNKGCLHKSISSHTAWHCIYSSRSKVSARVLMENEAPSSVAFKSKFCCIIACLFCFRLPNAHEISWRSWWEPECFWSCASRKSIWICWMSREVSDAWEAWSQKHGNFHFLSSAFSVKCKSAGFKLLTGATAVLMHV